MNPWYKRSELWVVLVNSVVLFLADGLGWKVESSLVVGIAGPVIAYALSRGYVKGKEAENSLFGPPSAL